MPHSLYGMNISWIICLHLFTKYNVKNLNFYVNKKITLSYFDSFSLMEKFCYLLVIKQISIHNHTTQWVHLISFKSDFLSLHVLFSCLSCQTVHTSFCLLTSTLHNMFLSLEVHSLVSCCRLGTLLGKDQIPVGSQKLPCFVGSQTHPPPNLKFIQSNKSQPKTSSTWESHVSVWLRGSRRRSALRRGETQTHVWRRKQRVLAAEGAAAL